MDNNFARECFRLVADNLYRGFQVAHFSVTPAGNDAVTVTVSPEITPLNAALPSSSDSPLVVTLDETGRAWAAGRPATVRDVRGTGLYGQPAGGGPGAWSFDLPPGPPDNNCLNLDLEGDRVYVSTFGRGIARLQGAERWTYWFPSSIGDTSSTRFWQPWYP